MEELVRQLVEISKKKRDAYGLYETIRDAELQCKEQMAKLMSEAGLKSAKTDVGSVSFTPHNSFLITDEKATMGWLKENVPDYSHYVGIKKSDFDLLAKMRLKSTGEIIPGTELRVTESISVRASKPKESK